MHRALIPAFFHLVFLLVPGTAEDAGKVSSHIKKAFRIQSFGVDDGSSLGGTPFQPQRPTALAASMDELANPFFVQAQSGPSCGPPTELLARLSERLAASDLIVQRGDAIVILAENETASCAPNCAFQNPNSPYALIRVPFSPRVDQQRLNALASVAPSYLMSTNRSELQYAFQLDPDDVILVTGCTPSSAISRYFSITGYVSDLYDPAKQKWVRALASLGDSLGLYRDPSGVGEHQRLNTTGLPEGFTASSSSLSDRRTGTTWTAPDGSTKVVQDPYGQAFVVLMGASPSIIKQVKDLIAPELPTKDTAISVLPVSAELVRSIGSISVAPRSPYFSAIIRNIIPAGFATGYRQYLTQSPLAVARITTKRSASQLALLDSYAVPTVISRQNPAIGDEFSLRPAVAFLTGRISGLYNRGFSIDLGFEGGAALDAFGIDWGIDCIAKKTDLCNGDTRDTTYLSTLPWFSLANSDFVFYVGTVASGLAAYFSVAASNVEARLGIQALEDSEIRGSAAPWLVGTPYESVSDKLFVVRIARNCGPGEQWCIQISETGPRAVPLSNHVSLMSRTYINPITGVGPPAAALAGPRVVILKPLPSIDSPSTVTRFIPASEYMASPCGTPRVTAIALACASLASGGSGAGVDRRPPPDCCSNLASFVGSNCHCTDIGQRTLEALTFPAPALFFLGLICRQAVPRCAT